MKADGTYRFKLSKRRKLSLKALRKERKLTVRVVLISDGRLVAERMLRTFRLSLNSLDNG